MEKINTIIESKDIISPEVESSLSVSISEVGIGNEKDTVTNSETETGKVGKVRDLKRDIRKIVTPSDSAEKGVPKVDINTLTSVQAIVEKFIEVESTPDLDPASFIEEQRVLDLIAYQAQQWLDTHHDRAAYSLFRKYGMKVEFGMSHRIKHVWRKWFKNTEKDYDEAYFAQQKALSSISTRVHQNFPAGSSAVTNASIEKYNKILKKIPEGERKDLKPMDYL